MSNEKCSPSPHLQLVLRFCCPAPGKAAPQIFSFVWSGMWEAAQGVMERRPAKGFVYCIFRDIVLLVVSEKFSHGFFFF